MADCVASLCRYFPCVRALQLSLCATQVRGNKERWTLIYSGKTDAIVASEGRKESDVT